MVTEELVTVRRFRGEAEAVLWKQYLKAAGISSVLIHENQSMVKGNVLVELQVKPGDYEKARELLKETPSTLKPKVGRWQRWLTIGILAGSFLGSFVFAVVEIDDIAAKIILGLVCFSFIGFLLYFLVPRKPSNK